MEKLLRRLPKKYHNRIQNFEPETGLIDKCKYIVTFADGWYWGHDYKTLPCKSVTEAIQFIRQAAKR